MTQQILVTVTLKDKILQQHSFPARSVMIGRQRESDVVLDNPGISRVHAEISYEDGCFYLNDCGSSNGSLLNGRKIDREELRDGDVVTIGKFQLHIHIPSKSGTDGDSNDPHARDLTVRAPTGSDGAKNKS